MKLQKSLALTLATLCLGSAQAHAEEGGDAATFSLQIPGLIYSSSEEKSKEGDAEEVKTTTNGMSTSNLAESYAYITSGKFIFYVYPFQDDTSEIAASYMVSDNLEVGLGLGLNSATVKAGEVETELASNIFSPFAALYTKLGPFDSEHIFTLRLVQGSGKAQAEDNEEVIVKSSLSTTSLSYDLNLVQSVAKNFYLVHGLSIASESGETKTEVGTAAAVKTKTSSMSWSINLVGLRITI